MIGAGPPPIPEPRAFNEQDVQLYLRSHPGIGPDVRDALIWSLKHEGAPFRWSDPPISARILDRMVLDRLLVKVEGGRYHFRDLQTTARGFALWQAEVATRAAALEEARFASAAAVPPPPGTPGDLFSEIIGYESPKRQIFMALAARAPVHVLLVGPPATAKSLFLEGLSTLPGAVYRFGDAIRRAGLRRYLMDEKPPYLIIDEIEKFQEDEDTALLEFMERQRVSMIATGINRDEALNIRVFGAANKIQRMRPELLSRFHQIRLREYTVEEFRAVARQYLKKRGVNSELAGLIADGVAGRTRDIRDCRRVSEMARSLADAQFLLDELGKEASV